MKAGITEAHRHLGYSAQGFGVEGRHRKGDIITHVDGEPTTGKDYEYVLEGMLRGPAYTEVTLTIRRTSSDK
jgi:C-terminal processing protease CtpA/Prc